MLGETFTVYYKVLCI